MSIMKSTSEKTEMEMVSKGVEIIPDKCQSVSQSTVISKRKIIKNLVVLSFGHLFLFTAFMGLANLQSTVNSEDGKGVISQSVIYASFIISSLFLPKLVIKKLGCKLTIVVSILVYSPYIAANFYPKMATLIPTAILLGFGAGNLWSSTGTTINKLSYLYANENNDCVEIIISKFFGIFLTFYKTTQIWGNLISFYVLQTSKHGPELTSEIVNSTTIHKGNTSDDVIVCGRGFCGGIDQIIKYPSDTQKYILIGIYFTLSIFASVIVLIFMDLFKCSKTATECDDDGPLLKLLATLKQLMNTDQQLLVILTTFVGLHQGFVFGDYTEAYIACGWGLEKVGLVLTCFGLVDAVMCFSVGHFLKYVPRIVLTSVAAASNLCLYIALFMWVPNDQHVVYFFIVVSVWAVADAIWQTQILTLYGVLFRDNEEAAFANHMMWEAMGFFIAFGLSSVLCVTPKLCIQLVFLVVGMAGYIAVEVRIFRKKQSLSDT